jgi:hypothetical protein
MKKIKRARAAERPSRNRHGGYGYLSRPSDGGTEQTMATIVEYTDQKRPRNLYPERIISPPSSGPCCFSDMEEIGGPQEEGRWVFQYKRCRKCGFAVRVILREIPDAALAAELRKTLANSFVRNVPD